jgi:hypothetical protein
MRLAKIVDGVVVNIEEWDVLPEADKNVTYVELTENHGAGIGMEYDGSEFTAKDLDPVEFMGSPVRISREGEILESLPINDPNEELK